MISQDRRVAIRRDNQPLPIELLDELEVVEAQARMQHEQILLLKQRNDDLRAKILRAVKELT